jgi:hypothetical protein
LIRVTAHDNLRLGIEYGQRAVPIVHMAAPPARCTVLERYGAPDRERRPEAHGSEHASSGATLDLLRTRTRLAC